MRRIWCLTFLVMGLFVRDGQCYVDSSPTLGGMCYAATDILVIRVKKVSRENRVIVYEPTAAIKGRMPQEEIKHDLRRAANQRAAQALLDWAEPGKIAVCFTTAAVSVTYTGEAWPGWGNRPTP